ncbi:DUF998 domain-containing protein [Dactylosporangium sp. NPDC000555]|uniref:DUF998 domain-containing protein n=1 Tax=Dactylosporangium sp. NPDC000555 TaxID=3154260 RepID=UPI00331AC4B7
MISRWAAAGSAIAGTLGAAGLAVAVAGSAPWRYVSESGAPGAPHAPLYQASMLLLAASLALLAVPARRTCALIGGSLGLAAPLAVVAGVVHCSPGCPLPPYETPAVRDLIHAAGAIGALLLCALAILLYSVLPTAHRLRRAGRVGMLVAYPPLILSAAGILFAGRSLFTGVTERIALIAVSAWVVLTAALHLRIRVSSKSCRNRSEAEVTA